MLQSLLQGTPYVMAILALSGRLFHQFGTCGEEVAPFVSRVHLPAGLFLTLHVQPPAETRASSKKCDFQLHLDSNPFFLSKQKQSCSSDTAILLTFCATSFQVSLQREEIVLFCENAVNNNKGEVGISDPLREGGGMQGPQLKRDSRSMQGG